MINQSNIKEVKSIEGLSKHLKKHFHEEYTLCFILDGRCQAWVDGKTIDLQQNNLLLVPGHVVHSCIPCGNTSLFFKVISIDEDWLAEFFQDKQLYNLFVNVSSIVINLDSDIPFIILDNSIDTDSAMFEHALADLIVSLSHKVKPVNTKTLTKTTKDLNYIVDYMNAHYQNDISLEDISEYAGLSKYYLIEKFKKQFKLTPYAYLLNLKINAAKSMLNKQQSLIDIAFDLGFYDQSHFTNVFMQYVGMTPQSYRNLIQ